MKENFTKLPRPLIVGSLRQRTVSAVIDDIRESEADGAQAFILHIQLMNEDFHNFDSFKEIADSTECPIMALNYRTEGGPDDAERIEVMRGAVRAGFRSVDIPMYVYDIDTKSSLNLSDLPFVAANPEEVSMRPEIIYKQKELIKEFKAMGVEVLMSAHVAVELSCEQVISLALEIQSRGVDIVKIISACESKKQQLDILHSNLELQKVLDTSFINTCAPRFIRVSAPLFGTMLVFGHHEQGELSNKQKPLISDIVKYYGMLE